MKFDKKITFYSFQHCMKNKCTPINSGCTGDNIHLFFLHFIQYG